VPVSLDLRSSLTLLAEMGNRRVRRITPEGIISTAIGGGSTTPGLIAGKPFPAD
jgi:hypothetical protein